MMKRIDYMADRQEDAGKFEFVTIAGARARQLLQGCTPKTSGSDKVVKIAQKEVKEGKVEKVPLAE